jgi:L-malate glycosyltransferase
VTTMNMSLTQEVDPPFSPSATLEDVPSAPVVRSCVLHVIDKSTIGGGQHNVLTLVSHLDGKAFNSIVACSPDGPLVQHCRDRGVRVYETPMSKSFRPDSMWKLLRVIREEGVGLVHAHGLVATAFAMGPAKAARVPIFYSQHGYHHRNYSNGLRPLRVAVEKLLAKSANLVICDSEVDASYGVREGYFESARCHVLPPPVDPEALVPLASEVLALRRELGLTDGVPAMGTVGRLDVAKGYGYLLEALARVGSTCPEFRFFFVGDGPERPGLEEKTAKLGLTGRVRFLGQRKEILPFLGLFELFVSSSLWEGLPVAICEAMAARLPVVATTVGGCPEVVAHGETGLLVPPRDPGSLGNALIALLRNAPRRRELGIRGRERIERHFSVASVLPRLEDLYQRSLSSRRIEKREGGSFHAALL